MVDGDSCRLGPYDPETDDPFAPEGGGARPCFAFHQMGTTVLHLEQRPVKARFRAGAGLGEEGREKACVLKSGLGRTICVHCCTACSDKRCPPCCAP